MTATMHLTSNLSVNFSVMPQPKLKTHTMTLSHLQTVAHIIPKNNNVNKTCTHAM